MPKKPQDVPTEYGEYERALTEAIGRRIRSRRKELGLRQEDLMQRMELESVFITRSQLSRIENGEFQPYARNEDLARPWVSPGHEGYEHRIGGLEKGHETGNVSYIPENHQLMTDLRKAKIQKVADYIPELEVDGPESGDLLVLGWGGTYGAITTAVARARAAGRSIGAAHLRYLNPFPKNIGKVLKSYKRVLIPELNAGQLRLLIRGEFLVDAKGLNKTAGLPFLVEEISQAIDLLMDGKWPADRGSLVPRHHGVSLDQPEILEAVSQ